MRAGPVTHLPRSGMKDKGEILLSSLTSYHLWQAELAPVPSEWRAVPDPHLLQHSRGWTLHLIWTAQ